MKTSQIRWKIGFKEGNFPKTYLKNCLCLRRPPPAPSHIYATVQVDPNQNQLKKVSVHGTKEASLCGWRGGGRDAPTRGGPLPPPLIILGRTVKKPRQRRNFVAVLNTGTSFGELGNFALPPPRNLLPIRNSFLGLKIVKSDTQNGQIKMHPIRRVVKFGLFI